MSNKYGSRNTSVQALVWLIFLIAGYILIFVWFGWELFVIFLILGISTNSIIIYNRNKAVMDLAKRLDIDIDTIGKEK